MRLGVGVSKVESDRVHLSDGTIIHAHTTIWATGVTAEPLARTIGSPTGRGGRLVVEPDLTIPGHPEIFAIGDIALTPDGDGKPLPQVAQPAIQGGKHVARQILRRRLDGARPEPFVYRDKGQMATIGRHDAVAELANGWRFSGPIGWLAWLGLHLVYLMGFRNRLNVFDQLGVELPDLRPVAAASCGKASADSTRLPTRMMRCASETSTAFPGRGRTCPPRCLRLIGLLSCPPLLLSVPAT